MPKFCFAFAVSLVPAPVSTTTIWPAPSRMRRQFMSSATRLRSSAGCSLSQRGLGTTPYISPPSSRWMPSLKISTWKRPMRTTRQYGEMDLREFRTSDGATVRAFWQTSGIRIRPGDDDRSLAAFAERNPGLFLLALDERGLAATALGAWDGRRGWLYHVAVRQDHRRRGLGARLVRTI